MKDKKMKEEKIHIHRVVQQQGITYDRAKEKYFGCFDDKGMINTIHLNDNQHQYQ